MSSQSDGSPNSSKIEIDMGLDPSYSEQSTLKRSPPSIKKSPPPPTNVPPAPPVPALPANKLNGKVITFGSKSFRNPVFARTKFVR